MAGLFHAAVLTKKGKELLAKAQANGTIITLTKAVTGDGDFRDGASDSVTQEAVAEVTEEANEETLTDDQIKKLEEMTQLKSKKQEFDLAAKSVQNQTNVYVKFIISNKKDKSGKPLESGYYVKEIGIYAKGTGGSSSDVAEASSTSSNGEEEILYAVAVAVKDQWDYMPSYNSLLPTTITIDFLIEVANADKVELVLKEETNFTDESTGKSYKIGFDGDRLYYMEAE